ncbi:hypothetical protein SV7mr_16440 [Stieleria bergensis]|uniref:Secreted protein n=2 Tax=Stieleria bergensis TaxID=2528025 RepID=A0A517SSN0_9BACT|nr:MAG: hypothetical protein CBB71_22445 [Rhodopirellula sp. TMED11]QDT59137.1 hypothetical protein SV7mr_16440 [Planctomycetes bacterium SV_7m_r]
MMNKAIFSLAILMISCFAIGCGKAENTIATPPADNSPTIPADQMSEYEQQMNSGGSMSKPPAK